MSQKLYKVFEVELSFAEYSTNTYFVSAESILDVVHLFKQHLGDEDTSEEYPIYMTTETYNKLTDTEHWHHFREMPNMFSDKRYKVWEGYCY